MRPWIPFVGAGAVLAALALPAAGATPAEAITDVLVRPQGWVVYIDTTPALTPTEQATRIGYLFFRRNGEVVGRTTAMAEGFNCEFKVRVTAEGVDLHPKSRACNDRYGDDAPHTRLTFDPADSTFPFKRTNVPQKWWMSPRP